MNQTGLRTHLPEAPRQPAAPSYETIFPYFAELCALSELRKKPGFGVPLRSGIGGHLLLYLNGVRVLRDRNEYPIIELCPVQDAAGQGAAISVNSHYCNANWVAFQDRSFVFNGALPAGTKLTRDAYMQTQRLARAQGLLEGITFHEHFFRDKPAGMSVEDFKYEISVATDYATCFGRDAYCARLPLSTTQMTAIVNYLNALNEPYRTGQKLYHWRLLNNNCVHVAHNALAAAGVWPAWPTGTFFIRAAFKFPVPKNAIVDLAARANDLELENPEALFQDHVAREALLAQCNLPTGPGGLTSIIPAMTNNEIYDTRKLRLIFYDNPFWGPYRFRFRRMFTEPRYTALGANLRHFARRYTEAAAKRPPNSKVPAAFLERYETHIAAQRVFLETWLPQVANVP
ncbi:DUF4105 domain-containing protein [Acidocella sp.]|uniref:DUF4105 domain-containing protein n=1 Tax=Acidocella sp. TaxID=50710 RepID=UPI00262E4E33|nr:DUF4105 domain-containing protein [Acidocella sp.]